MITWPRLNGFLWLVCFGFCGAKADTFSPPNAAGWEIALPGTTYQFPRDHALHPGYKTEWWYFTGSLQGQDGHEYGYELTFFRQGVIPPEGQTLPRNESESKSRFVQVDFKFGHFAISDISGKRFYYTQRINRGAFGETGFSPESSLLNPASSAPGTPLKLVWLEDWSLLVLPDGRWQIAARSPAPEPMSLDLIVSPTKPPVIQGLDGVSQKAEGVGNASHYYSFTRMETSGHLRLDNASPENPVRGLSWFDHEWASNQLAADQVGWDWFCFQFEDQTELMLYAMRRRDGSVDPASSGTWIDAAGNSTHLHRDQIDLRPTATWRSPQTGTTYPVAWTVQIASLSLDLAVTARLKEQELVLPPISYWEGAIRASGQRAGLPVKATGYMELTGYAGALRGLQGQTPSAASKLRQTPR